MSVADFGFKPWPSVSALKAAGVTGVVQYVAGGSADKHITTTQYRALVAGGLDVALVWEAAAGTLGTAFDAAGAARAALAAANALGYTGVIYWAVDYDVTASQWPTVRNNMRAIAGVLGLARTGIYGSTYAIDWAARDGVASRFWQSMSHGFSGGHNGTVNPKTHLWQRRQLTIGGADVDLNDIRKPDWAGQQQEDDVALSDADKTWIVNQIKGGASGLTTDQLQQWLGDGVDGRNTPATSVEPRPSLALVLKKLDGVGGGLTDADRALIQKLTDAVTELNSRLASP